MAHFPGDNPGLEEPLLANVALKANSKHNHEEQTASHQQHGLGYAGGVLNLCKAVLGAGLLSIPRAFSLLGGLVGTAAFLLVSLLTVFTIDMGMIQPSVAHGTSSGGGRGGEGARGQDVLALSSYAAAVSYWVGRRAERLLSVIMVVGLLGFSATFLDIIADILVGDEVNPGLLTGGVAVLCSCNVFSPSSHSAGHHESGSGSNATLSALTALLTPSLSQSSSSTTLMSSLTPAMTANIDDDAFPNQYSRVVPLSAKPLLEAGWLEESFVDVHVPAWARVMCDRRVVLLGVVVGLLLPLAVQRNMGSLSAVNAVGLASLVVLLVSLLWLAGSALWQGSAYALPLMPDFESLGDSATVQALVAFGTMSVLLTANGCHANMHPLMLVMQPFSGKSVRRVLATTITLTTTYYWLLSVAAYIVFGQNIQEDILTNLSPVAMAPLVGQWAGLSLAFVLRAGYMVSIMGSAVLTMFPLRQSCIDLLLGSAADPMQRTDSSGHISVNLDHAHSSLEGGSITVVPAAAVDSLMMAHSGPASARHSASGNSGTVSARVTGSGTPGTRQLAPEGSAEVVSAQSLIPAAGTQDVASIVKSSDANVHVSALSNGALHSSPTDNAIAIANAASAAQQHASLMAAREQRADAMHVPLTVGLMATAYIAAVAVPSIWIVISLVGSVSLTLMCFVMPALIGLYALGKNRHLGRTMRQLVRWVLYGVMLLGGLVFINGWIVTAINIQRGKASGPA